MRRRATRDLSAATPASSGRGISPARWLTSTPTTGEVLLRLHGEWVVGLLTRRAHFLWSRFTAKKDTLGPAPTAHWCTPSAPPSSPLVVLSSLVESVRASVSRRARALGAEDTGLLSPSDKSHGPGRRGAGVGETQPQRLKALVHQRGRGGIRSHTHLVRVAWMREREREPIAEEAKSSARGLLRAGHSCSTTHDVRC